jgi:hypothetical protein
MQDVHALATVAATGDLGKAAQQRTTRIINATIAHLGGEDRLAYLAADELNRARGELPDGTTHPQAERNQKVLHWKISDLIRKSQQNDDAEQLPEVFDDEDKQAYIEWCAYRMLLSKPDKCAEIVRRVVRDNPQLLDELIAERKQTLDARVVELIAVDGDAHDR